MTNYYKSFFIITFISLLFETFFILKLSDSNFNPLVGTAIIASSFFCCIILFIVLEEYCKDNEVEKEDDKIKIKEKNSNRK